MTIFLDDTDYRKFFYILSDVVDEYDVECWDACAMPNHYHVAVRNRKANLPEALQHLNGEYALWWNARHGRVGHVFQGRYKDQIVQRDGYFLNLLRYIALNPIRAGLVDSPELWPWSTYRCIAGLSPNPGFVSDEPALAAFGNAATHVLRERYVRHVAAVLQDENDRYRVLRSRQRIVGDRDFKLEIRNKVETPVPVLPTTAEGLPANLS